MGFQNTLAGTAKVAAREITKVRLRTGVLQLMGVEIANVSLLAHVLVRAAA